MTTDEARKLARASQSDERFYHTECVAKAAVMLAGRYGADAERAELAALLHDILKERDKADLLQMLRGSAIIDFTEIEPCPALYHSFAGGIYVHDVLGLDMEIADAVRYHTAGRVGMTLLDKIVFLADYISDDRDFRGADEVRAIAQTSLNEAVFTALRNGLAHLFRKNLYVYPPAVRAYNDLLDKREN